MSLRKVVNNETDHIQGNKSAPIEIVEYGDYQCPYCRKAYPVIKQLQKELGSRLKFVFRNFPLETVHPDAVNASITAEIASTKGKYWEMHDMLYENQGRLSFEDLLGYAEKLGIDKEYFEAEFDKPIYKEIIDEDIESGLRSGVNGTPSLYINGEKYDGNPYSADDIIAYMDLML